MKHLNQTFSQQKKGHNVLDHVNTITFQYETFGYTNLNKIYKIFNFKYIDLFKQFEYLNNSTNRSLKMDGAHLELKKRVYHPKIHTSIQPY